MENYKDLKFQNEIGNSLILPIKDAGSIILEPNLGLPERLGKYELIYDYNAVPAPLFYNLASSLNSIPPSMYKEGGSNANMIAKSGIWSGIPTGETKQFVTYTVNPNAQVGVFSKGNIVNVIRFEGSNAIVENPNFVEAQATTTTTTSGWNWGSLLGAKVENTKEIKVPKDYLSKVDDSTPITISTGINFGANPKPQPVYDMPPVKPTIGSGTQLGQVLETNVTYTINKPFTFTKSYTNVRPLYELGGAGKLQYEQKANYDTLPIGLEVTGNLMSQMLVEKKSFSNMGVPPLPKYVQDVLVVNGMGQNGQLVIPIEYLTKKVPTNVTTNNGIVVPSENNNKNILMIIGAFLVGYVLFNKGKSE